MREYQFISDYKHIDKYKESFNELAKLIFGIDFKSWYDKGYWGDNYICYSYVDGDQVIANASISKMTVISNGQEFSAIQVGTVMTHPAYRCQGLSEKLMNYIVTKYEHECDFIYLFANDSVLDFYPRFGFERMQESNFTLNISDYKRSHLRSSSVRILNTEEPADLKRIERFATESKPISSVFNVTNHENLLMFYFSLVFNDSIYYIEEEDVIVIFKQEDQHLHIFDIISTTEVDIDTILNSLITADTEIIHFYFTPDYSMDNINIHSELNTKSDDTLFVRPLLKELPKHFMFPLTSHA